MKNEDAQQDRNSHKSKIKRPYAQEPAQVKIPYRYSVIRCFLFQQQVCDQEVRRCIPNISIQKDEVSAVMAPSADGNKADIRARMNITDTYDGI